MRAIIANWQLPLATLAVSIVIGVIMLACMVRGPTLGRNITLHRIVAAASFVPTLIILVALGFAAPMVAPHPPESRVGDALCTALVIVQLATLTFAGIAYARQAARAAPMRAAGAGTGCTFLIVLTLLEGLGAAEALAGTGF